MFIAAIIFAGIFTVSAPILIVNDLNHSKGEYHDQLTDEEDAQAAVSK